ncbi:Probable aspartic protease At2g35615 [Linum grandiflorum]
MFNAYNGVDDVNRNTSVVVSGSVGLGPGPTSIVSTVYEYSLSTSFAYCLSPPFVNSGTSKIGFGVDYEDGCNGTKSTSMWFSAPYSDYRFVLSAISIGDEMVVFSQDNQTVLNMIMDVGTPLTYLPINFYEEVALKVESQTKHLTRVADPLALLGLCYNVSNTSDHALFDIDVPTVTLQLGLDGYHVVTPLKLKAANVFVKTADDVACLAFVPTRSMDTGVYGNLAQTGFLVTYDLGQSMLSFKETNCYDI